MQIVRSTFSILCVSLSCLNVSFNLSTFDLVVQIARVRIPDRQCFVSRAVHSPFTFILWTGHLSINEWWTIDIQWRIHASIRDFHIIFWLNFKYKWEYVRNDKILQRIFLDFIQPEIHCRCDTCWTFTFQFLDHRKFNKIALCKENLKCGVTGTLCNLYFKWKYWRIKNVRHFDNDMQGST